MLNLLFDGFLSMCSVVNVYVHTCTCVIASLHASTHVRDSQSQLASMRGGKHAPSTSVSGESGDAAAGSRHW